MRTVNTAHFQSTRPLRLQSRQSAAYKRIMALLYKGKGLDLMRGVSIDIVNSMETAPDIQLPAKATAKKRDTKGISGARSSTRCLCCLNRTEKLEALPPASAQRNTLRKLSSNRVNSVIESNLIDWNAFINDDFDAYFKAGAMALLDAIEFAMGKSISDRGTEETVKRFGCSLE